MVVTYERVNLERAEFLMDSTCVMCRANADRVRAQDIKEGMMHLVFISHDSENPGDVHLEGVML